jgi:hypothetical protein
LKKEFLFNFSFTTSPCQLLQYHFASLTLVTILYPTLFEHVVRNVALLLDRNLLPLPALHLVAVKPVINLLYAVVRVSLYLRGRITKHIYIEMTLFANVRRQRKQNHYHHHNQRELQVKLPHYSRISPTSSNVFTIRKTIVFHPPTHLRTSTPIYLHSMSYNIITPLPTFLPQQSLSITVYYRHHQ